jgi:Bacterial PH domain
MENDNAPSDLLKLLDQDEQLLLYMKQKKYHPAINIDSVAITNRRVIFRKPSMLTIKKSFTDYSYADILNVTIDKGPLRSTLNLNLRMDGSDLLVDDIPNDAAQEAFKLIRQGIDSARSKFTV